jgi:hypothetical protein
MAQKGVRKVETIRHDKLGVEVPLFLDMQKMEFRAEYRGERFTGKDGEDVRDRVLTFIQQENAITWHRVIEVRDESGRLGRANDEGGENPRQVGVSMFYRRYWLGLAASGRILQAAWKTVDDDNVNYSRFATAVELKLKPRAVPEREAALRARGRLAGVRESIIMPKASEVTLPWREETPVSLSSYDTPRTLLAYTDELWHGVEAIAAVIERERQQLAALVRTTEAFDMVAELGAGAMAKLLTAPNDEDIER